jgi:hypothetical protein
MNGSWVKDLGHKIDRSERNSDLTRSHSFQSDNQAVLLLQSKSTKKELRSFPAGYDDYGRRSSM